jgi:hypothetical protein
MEHESRVLTKVTAEGLVLDIDTGNASTRCSEANADLNISDLYSARRLKSELSAILKISIVPNTLLDLAQAAHDHYQQKHLQVPTSPPSPVALRNLLSFLLSRSFATEDEAAVHVLY